MKSVQPSRRFKAVAGVVAAVASASAFALLLNKMAVGSGMVYSLAQIGLLFSLNMSLALPVRLCMRTAAGMRSHWKIAAVGCILVALIGLLYLDSAFVDSRPMTSRASWPPPSRPSWRRSGPRRDSTAWAS